MKLNLICNYTYPHPFATMYYRGYGGAGHYFCIEIMEIGNYFRSRERDLRVRQLLYLNALERE